MASFKKLLLLAAAAKFASAHFGLEYPEWRVDTLTNEEEYSQYEYPCAGVPGNEGNVTDWPLTGGSLKLDLHHPWSYVFVNLGFGQNVSNFNVSLTDPFWNTTGKGSLCVSELRIPDDVGTTIRDGGHAAIQVVTLGETGTALYNCANIRFNSSAKPLSGDACKSDVTQSVVGASSNNSDGGNGTSSEGDTGAATGLGINMVALTSVVGLSLAFAAGLGV